MTLWEKQAKQWSLLGSPLRPITADIQDKLDWIKERKHSKSLTVLLLGVTPELVNLPWPPNTLFFAIDVNLTMIHAVLPAESRVKPIALAGNWLQLPFRESSVDIVMGDNCYNVLTYQDYALLSEGIRRVLKPDGVLFMRFLTRPDERDTIALLQQDLYSGVITNFHAFKLRLAMVLHQALQQGVCLREVWNQWRDHFKEYIHAHQHQLGWSAEVISTIDNYQNADSYYTFPTLKEVRSSLSDYFTEQAMSLPDYEFGNCCPSFKLTPIKR